MSVFFTQTLYIFFFFFRECAERLFDLQAVPGRYFFELLAKFTADETEREKFIEFTTFDGQQDLFDYCNR